MKKNSLRVALNMTTSSVSEKIKKATAVFNALSDHADVFATPTPDLKNFGATISNLTAAFLATADGAKSKTVALHEAEADLMRQMFQLATYVEQVAHGDESIIHLAAFDVRKKGQRTTPEFSATPVGQGQVLLKAKARGRVIYKWQYSADNGAVTPAWTDAFYSNSSKAAIEGLSTGFYLFRVIVIDKTGEHAGSTVHAAIN